MGTTSDFDLLVVGGGINGTAIARHAAGDGLSVLLCERDDLASHTSSASTKLIHGGLRYLEHYDFKLVREALIEREVLLQAAPHIIWPMRFVLPYGKAKLGRGMRPAWMLRLGLFLYDHLGGRKILPSTTTIRPNDPAIGEVLQEGFELGFEYSDCWVEDSRLVVLNAVDAVARGANIRTRTTVSAIRAVDAGVDAGVDEGYEAELQDADGRRAQVRARAVVNAAGPWVADMLQRTESGVPRTNRSELRLVKGSHIVVPKLYGHDRAYIFQNADNRVVFAIPYERDYTLIGTTDEAYELAEGAPEISDGEIGYLCRAASEYFKTAVVPGDIVWTYSGVRPLYDDQASDASSVTRDYVLDLRKTASGAPMLSVYGGKITTSRHLALDAMQTLHPLLAGGRKASNWTRKAVLPGGDIPELDAEAYAAALSARHPGLSPRLILRLVRAYGSDVPGMLDGAPAEDTTSLTPRLPDGLIPAEIRHMVGVEFATQADDILWRRSKLGLHMTAGERAAFAAWFAAEHDGRESAAPSEVVE